MQIKAHIFTSLSISCIFSSLSSSSGTAQASNPFREVGPGTAEWLQGSKLSFTLKNLQEGPVYDTVLRLNPSLSQMVVDVGGYGREVTAKGRRGCKSWTRHQWRRSGDKCARRWPPESGEE